MGKLVKGIDEISPLYRCGYYQGREDREEEIKKAFTKLFGNEYSWTEVIEKANQMKESKNG